MNTARDKARNAAKRQNKPKFLRALNPDLSPEERDQWEQIRVDLATKREADREAAKLDCPLDELPDAWLIDSRFLLDELARIRDLANRMPVTQKSLLPAKSVVDAIWNLEEQLRFLLRMHRDGQQSFAKKAAELAPQAVEPAQPLRAGIRA